MLAGVKIKSLQINSDERGYLSEVLRADWDDFIKEEIVQANISYCYPDTIRAWHRHLRNQIDYLTVLRGAIKACIYDENSGELDEATLLSNFPQIIRIPGIYWHGFKVIGYEPAMVLYFFNKLYNYGTPDELRRSWNDPKIVPKKINGKDDDPRCNKAWDWDRPPFR